MREYSSALKAKAIAALSFMSLSPVSEPEETLHYIDVSLRTINLMLFKEYKLLNIDISYDDISEYDIEQRLLKIAPNIEAAYKHMRGQR